MLKTINKIPAGTFLVPMIVAALLFTFFPGFADIGGLTEATFSGKGLSTIIGAICFCSGTGINLGRLTKVLKHHGLLLLLKIAIGIIASLLFMQFFGQAGIFGLTAVGFVVAICSINPAIYLSLAKEYGDEEDISAFGLTGLFSIPSIPMIIYGLNNPGGMDWTPVLSTLIPLIAGMILGNLDTGFNQLFGAGVSVLIPIMGWNIGAGLNLIEAVAAGGVGIVLAVIYYLLSLPLFILDTKILKYNGVSSVSLMSAAGLSVSTPAILAATYPELAPYVTSGAAQVLMVVIITSIITPILVARLHKNVA